MATHLQSFSTLKGAYIPTTFPIASVEEVEQAVQAIAEEIMELGDVLLATTNEETSLPIARLTGERGRTCTQLKLYAHLLRSGNWCDAVMKLNAMPVEMVSAILIKQLLNEDFTTNRRFYEKQNWQQHRDVASRNELKLNSVPVCSPVLDSQLNCFIR